MCTVDKNSVVLDFCQLQNQPSPKLVKKFLADLQVNQENLRALQLCNRRKIAVLQFADSAMASSIIDKPLVYQGCKIPIYLDNNATEVRVLDLPLGISNDDVVKVMSKYGEILTITNDRWINFFPGIPNGVRTLRMLLKQPTPKSITVNNAAATVTIIGKKSLCKLKAKNKKCADSSKKVDQKSSTQPIEPEPSSSSSKSNNSKPEQNAMETSEIDEEDNDGFETVLSKHTRRRKRLQAYLDADDELTTKRREMAAEETTDEEDEDVIKAKYYKKKCCEITYKSLEEEDEEKLEELDNSFSKYSAKYLKHRQKSLEKRHGNNY